MRFFLTKPIDDVLIHFVAVRWGHAFNIDIADFFTVFVTKRLKTVCQVSGFKSVVFVT